jgi:hypothetical protein
MGDDSLFDWCLACVWIDDGDDDEESCCCWFFLFAALSPSPFFFLGLGVFPFVMGTPTPPLGGEMELGYLTAVFFFLLLDLVCLVGWM